MITLICCWVGTHGVCVRVSVSWFAAGSRVGSAGGATDSATVGAAAIAASWKSASENSFAADSDPIAGFRGEADRVVSCDVAPERGRTGAALSLTPASSVNARPGPRGAVGAPARGVSLDGERVGEAGVAGRTVGDGCWVVVGWLATDWWAVDGCGVTDWWGVG
ncbi:hypothetical protein [Nocardia takedensis]|uniref:hypothetical protein n=1 Tax=Nocardia takedensis TaxID=259390 RepID=UPI000594B299|nr:hypothetical protein [Nocardia takedensis]